MVLLFKKIVIFVRFFQDSLWVLESLIYWIESVCHAVFDRFERRKLNFVNQKLPEANAHVLKRGYQISAVYLQEFPTT